MASAWERLAAADRLVYIDLPLAIHYLWVTKRFIKGMLVKPEGWPENSPMWRSTIAGYRVMNRVDMTHHLALRHGLRRR